MNRHIRNITIGLIDGITIPLTLAAALSASILSTPVIALACMAVALAGAITIAAGAYFEGRRYEPQNKPLKSALTIGLSYLSGGVWIAAPFAFSEATADAFRWAAFMSLPVLFASGFIESSIAGGKGWHGGVRASLTGGLAAFAAYSVVRAVI